MKRARVPMPMATERPGRRLTVVSIRAYHLIVPLVMVCGEAAGQVTYEKHFTGVAYALGEQIHQSTLATDGRVYTVSGREIFKEDPNGQTIWHRRSISASLMNIAENGAGELVMLGGVIASDSGFALVRMDTAGTFLSGWQYSTPWPWFPADMELDADGNAYIVGSQPTSIAKIAANGTVAWSKRFDCDTLSRPSLAIGPDGQLYIVTTGIHGGVQVTRMDTSGTVLNRWAWEDVEMWPDEYWFPTNMPAEIDFRTDGKWLISVPLFHTENGTGFYQELSLFVTDSTGIIHWLTTLKSALYNPHWELLADNSVVIAHHPGLLTRIQNTGVVASQRKIIDVTWPSVADFNLTMLPDGGALISGIHPNLSIGPDNYGHFIRIDNTLTGVCHDAWSNDSTSNYALVLDTACTLTPTAFPLSAQPILFTDTVFNDMVFGCGTVGIQSLEERSVPVLAPNPADAWTIVSASGDDGYVRVMDASGRVLLETVPVSNTVRVHTADLAAGSYLVYVGQSRPAQLVVIH